MAGCELDPKAKHASGAAQDGAQRRACYHGCFRAAPDDVAPRSATQHRLLSGGQSRLCKLPRRLHRIIPRKPRRMLWDEFCFATTQPLPDAELEKLQAEEARARRICEGLCGPTLAPLLQDACARVSTHLDAAATGCESLLEATEDRLRAMREAPPLMVIQRDCVIAATAPFALIAEGLNCLTPQTPPPAAAPAPAPEPEKPDGWVAHRQQVRHGLVCTNV